MEVKIKAVQDKCAEYGWEAFKICLTTKKACVQIYNRKSKVQAWIEIKPKSWVAYDGDKSEKLMSGTTEPADGVQKLLEQYYYCQKLKQ